MTNEPDPIKRLRIDDGYDSYTSFYDHELARELNAIAARTTRLDELLVDLQFTTKGLSRAFSMPQIAVQLTKSYHDGYDLGKSSTSPVRKLIRRLANEVKHETLLSNKDDAEVKRALERLCRRLLKETDGIEMEFPLDEMWKSLVEVVPNDKYGSAKNELRLGLWATMRTVYSALYFAYEDFFVRMLNIVREPSPTVRISHDHFNSECRRVFGEDIFEECWLDAKLQTAKAVRHALVHAGGRETDDLKKKGKHGIVVQDGVLQILPAHIVLLYDHMKPKIKMLVEWGAEQPALQ